MPTEIEQEAGNIGPAVSSPPRPRRSGVWSRGAIGTRDTSKLPERPRDAAIRSVARNATASQHSPSTVPDPERRTLAVSGRGERMRASGPL